MPFSAHVLHVSFILVDTEDHCHLVSIDLVSAGLSPAKKRDHVLKRLVSTLDWRSHLALRLSLNLYILLTYKFSMGVLHDVSLLHFKFYSSWWP